MIVAKLFVGRDRCRAKNKPKDLGLDSMPTETEDGRIVCGIGTSYDSEEAHELDKARSREEQRIREFFKAKFMKAPSSVSSRVIPAAKRTGRQTIA